MTDEEREEAYQEIYDDARADLDIGQIDNLYQHFISTCQKLFRLAEYDFFHAPHDLPDDWLQEIVTEYLECQNNHFLLISQSALSYAKPHLSYRPSEPIAYLSQNDKCTIYNLAKVLWEERFGLKYARNIANIGKDKHHFETRKIHSDRANQITSLKEHLTKLRIYLFRLFGIDYDNEQEMEHRYETLRLLRILHDCIEKYNVDLSYLCRSSALRFQHNLPSKYREAMLFIRERIITPPLPHQLDFGLIIRLELYVNAVRSYLHFLGDNLVDCILENLPCASWKARQATQAVCYRIMLFRLKKRKEETAPTFPQKQEIDLDVFRARTYIHFLTLGTMDSIAGLDDYKSTGNSTLQKLDIPDEVYNCVQQYADIKINTTEEDISDFCKQNKSLLVLWLQEAARRSSNTFAQTMKRNKKDYCFLARFSNYLDGKSHKGSIDGERLLLLLFLSEKIKQSKIDIPLTSGYSGEGNAKPIKIKNALQRLYQWADDGFPDTDDIEVYLISLWLSHRIYAATTYRTYRIQAVEQEMKNMLLQVWNQTISPIYYRPPKYESNILEDFTNKIISIEDMRRIREWAIKRYVPIEEQVREK